MTTVTQKSKSNQNSKS